MRATARKRRRFQNVHRVLDLIPDDDRANVHACDREVRPPSAPTAGTGRTALLGADGRIDRPWPLIVTYSLRTTRLLCACLEEARLDDIQRTATPSIPVTIDFERPDSELAVSLIRQLDEDLCRRYPDMPPQLIHGLHPSDLADPKFAFLVGRIDRRAVGCGALRNLEPGVGEIKRMFVLPDFRRHGIARRILAALEARAVELGYGTVRLETGKAQPEAVCLYGSAGYREISGFGEYVGSPYSICFEKMML